MTKVGGIRRESVTWTLAGSPYEITETVQIPTGVVLTIEPGTVVYMPTDGDMFLLHGTLIAVGEPNRPIVFDGGGNSNFFNPRGSDADTFLRVEHAIIRNGQSFWPPTGYSQRGHFHLRNSLIENLTRYSYIWYPQKDVYIESNVFRNSAGFSVGHREADVIIRWNRFESRPAGLPSYMDYWVENWAAYGSSETVVEYNSFLNSGEVALKLPGGYSSAAMTATYNYWGTTDEAVIQQMVYDQNVDITSAGVINYRPILTEPDDHGNDASSATPLLLGELATGAIGPSSDADFFSFEAEAGQTYAITVALQTLHDSTLTLYDPSGLVELDFDDDYGGTRASQIVWTAPTMDIYYVAVEAFGTGTGSYTLTITAY